MKTVFRWGYFREHAGAEAKMAFEALLEEFDSYDGFQ